ncbi:MAG TPA: saccharopine dehydrogenase NADP-binding domain-containing protein [Pseudonocardiaceae bacterium]|nr:saccharopine dehydrogenase NADP-binding domain-containing protein [Pseudonocardiaceae bacterium]
MLIAVYGATGYQAGLVLAELSRRSIPARPVGRDAARLRTFAGSRVATVDDHESLVAAFDGCDVVINCAGPFTGIGDKVVRAAVAAGCGYVDTAGEQPYVRGLFDVFTDAAVPIVPATNDGCLPVDLLARLVADRVGAVDDVTVAHIIRGGGGMSRGSLRSIGVIAGAATTGRELSITWSGESVALREFPVCETVTIPRHVTVGGVAGFVEAAVFARLGAPVAPETVPVGPSEQDRRGQGFAYVLDADGTRGVIRGTDTYGTTAVIAVEAARRLAVDGASPGVRAPAEAFDAAGFLDSLAPHGLRWSIEPR